jgi:hypothetical protein
MDEQAVLIACLDVIWPVLECASKCSLRLVSIPVCSRLDQLVTHLEIPLATEGSQEVTVNQLEKAGARWSQVTTLALKGLHAEQCEEQLNMVAKKISGDTFPLLNALELTLVSTEQSCRVGK